MASKRPSKSSDDGILSRISDYSIVQKGKSAACDAKYVAMRLLLPPFSFLASDPQSHLIFLALFAASFLAFVSYFEICFGSHSRRCGRARCRELKRCGGDRKPCLLVELRKMALPNSCVGCSSASAAAALS